MFVPLNGSFGIGKSTAAKALVQALQGSAISDPEDVGYVLRRLPAWMPGLHQQPDDYQDLALWRRLIIYQARLGHLRAIAEGRTGLTAFERRRSAECSSAHADPAFGARVDATGSRKQIIADVLALIGR